MIYQTSKNSTGLIGFVRAAITAFALALTPAPKGNGHAQPTEGWTPAQCTRLAESARNVARDGLPPRQALINRTGELDRQIAASFNSDEVAFLREERAKACDSLFQSIVQDKLIGRTAPARVDPTWHIAPASFDFEALLKGARTSGNLGAYLEALAPQNLEYQRMREALAVLNGKAQKGDSTTFRREALVASLERKRWASKPWPRRYMIVDIAFFDARLIDSGRTIDRWKIIVGARRTPTPSFSAYISGVTLNPTWTPPIEIVRNELLPMLRRSPGGAAALGYRALDSTGAPIDTDWRQRPFPYRIVQSPGPRNALGRIKIEMPNPYAIYLHDTPDKELFAHSARALSHGCIRVEDPNRLALALLEARLDRAALDAAIATNVSQLIPLVEPLPVFVLYRTVRLGEDGALQFADDIYGRDHDLVEAIEGEGASPLAGRTTPPSECGWSLK